MHERQEVQKVLWPLQELIEFGSFSRASHERELSYIDAHLHYAIIVQNPVNEDAELSLAELPRGTEIVAD